MPRKKAPSRESKFDIQIGFIKQWDYSNKENAESMHGHPMVGRVYRIIKDAMGYRLHIGRENNDVGLDGLFLGPALRATRPDFEFDIEIVTPANYLKLPLSSEDAEKVLSWIDTENSDLWEKLKKEEDGTATTAIGKLPDIIDLIKLVQSDNDNYEQGRQIESMIREEGELNQKEQAAEAALQVITKFKRKSTSELLELFDGLYERLIKIQKS